MAVEDKYVNSDVAAGKLTSAYRTGAGGATTDFLENISIAAADDDTSKYRVLKNLNPYMVLKELKAWTLDTITLSTDWNIGFYESLENGGAAIDDNRLADALDFSSAITRLNAVDCMVLVLQADVHKPIYELAGDTISTVRKSYDLVFTAVTVGSAAGTITVEGTLLER